MLKKWRLTGKFFERHCGAGQTRKVKEMQSQQQQQQHADTPKVL
jgi:hypothetical protein